MAKDFDKSPDQSSQEQLTFAKGRLRDLHPLLRSGSLSSEEQQEYYDHQKAILKAGQGFFILLLDWKFEQNYEEKSIYLPLLEKQDTGERFYVDPSWMDWWSEKQERLRNVERPAFQSTGGMGQRLEKELDPFEGLPNPKQEIEIDYSAIEDVMREVYRYKLSKDFPDKPSC